MQHQLSTKLTQFKTESKAVIIYLFFACFYELACHPFSNPGLFSIIRFKNGGLEIRTQRASHVIDRNQIGHFVILHKVHND